VKTKPPKTYAEQIEIMKSRGCSVNDSGVALDFLANVSYYHLSGYFAAFRKPKSDEFVDGTTFEQITGVYEFDQRLRGILSDAIGVIELRVRTAVAYCHAQKYGELGYMDSQNFDDTATHEDFKRRFAEVVRQRSTSPIVRHHIMKYDGNFPIWAAMELFTVSMLSLFYSRMRVTEQKIVAKQFRTDYVHLRSWLYSLTVLRNRCAHYERLYGFNFNISPKLPKKYISVLGNNRHTLFAQVFMLKLLYRNLPNKWNTDVLAPLSELVKQFREYIDFAYIGFPENWEEILRRS
jgi:abortive infection bacteriophage resistance protein